MTWLPTQLMKTVIFIGPMKSLNFFIGALDRL